MEKGNSVHGGRLMINPKFRSLIPPLLPEERQQLEANLVADGCRDPLVIWDGALLDGHNRLEICERHGLPFKTVSLELADEDAAQVWIIHHQFGRRNLSAFARVELALKLEPLLRKQAKEKEHERKTTCQKSDKSSLPPKDTKKELAKAAHVSHDTIAKGKVILARASEETLTALRAGETTIHAEHRKLTVHVGHNSGENEWYTPAPLIKAARLVMGSIDCDPASSEQANKTVGANVFFDKESNGLIQKWSGNVWLNPPYAQPLMSQFAESVTKRFEDGGISQACVLVNNATETAWFQRMAGAASAICFPSSRVKFIDQEGKASGAPLQGQAVLYMGNRVKQFEKHFRSFGLIVHVV